jgi:hypothetical protein
MGSPFVGFTVCYDLIPLYFLIIAWSVGNENKEPPEIFLVPIAET